MVRSLVPALLLLNSSFASAERPDTEAPEVIRVQSHAGQTDTDGILSPGEIPNPKIDYDQAQRQGERR